MTERDENNSKIGSQAEQVQTPEEAVGELGAAGKSLSEALRISFIILKVIMVVLVVFFLASGFRTVGSGEQGLVLRFGKIQGVGEERLLGPGLHWIFPYPVDEIIRIPVEKKVTLAINSFWYFEKTPGQRPRPQLNPVREGYCLTRNEKQDEVAWGFSGSDYNIVHCKWQLTYKVDDPERFFKNNYVDIEGLQAGQNYADVIEENISPLLKSTFEDAVVTTMVHYSIDEAIQSQDRIPKHVKRLLQRKLDSIESGIKIISVYLSDITWPRQVDRAFQASITASQDREKVISEARLYSDKTLSETGGPVASELLEIINSEETSEERKEYLWSQVAGESERVIADARAYRTKIVETARANAEYLHQILPEYRKRPELVIHKIYQDAILEVLDNAVEKIILQPSEVTKGREVRILINRDPLTKQKPGEKK